LKVTALLALLRDGFKNEILHVKVLFKKLYLLWAEREKKEERLRKYVSARVTLKRGPNANHSCVRANFGKVS